MTVRLTRRAALLATAMASGLWCHTGSAADESEDPLEKAIDAGIWRAIDWLASEQQPSGAWKTNDYGESTATTALAIMAMLAAGHVPEEGPYGQQITRGVGWLLSKQQKNGLLVGRQRSETKPAQCIITGSPRSCWPK